MTKLFVKFGEPFNVFHEVIYPATKDTVIDNAKRFMLPIDFFLEVDSKEIATVEKLKNLKCVHCDQNPID